MNERGDLSRITIDIPKMDHRRLKAMAAVLGKSMRELVIESIKEHLHRYPNKQTVQVIKDAEEGKDCEKAESAEDLFKKLGI